MDLHEPLSTPVRGSLTFIPFLLPTPAQEPSSGPEWSHELKYDGYRTDIVLDGGLAKAFTRNGHDWTRNYGPIADAAPELRCDSAAIDGEVIVHDEDGKSDFHALRSSISSNHGELVLYAFDLLLLDGRDLRMRPLHERRAMLRDLVGENDPTFPIQSASRSRPTRPSSWALSATLPWRGSSRRSWTANIAAAADELAQIQCFQEREFVVIGAEHEKGKPAFALLARETEAGLVYPGSGFLTLSGEMPERFWNEVDRLERKKPAIPMPGHKRARWVTPELRVEVQYLAGGEMIPHGSVRELI